MIGKHAAPNEVGLTQSLGQVDAWTSRPSAYAVLARTTDDVVAAVNFARGEQFAARREGWWSFFLTSAKRS